MPRKYAKARRTRKVYRRRRNATAIARTALRKVNTIIRQEEVKKADFSTLQTPFTVDWTGAVFPVSAVISQGQGPYNRIGREVLIKYVTIQGKVTYNPGATLGGSNTVRFLVFIDRSQQLGLDPSPSVVLETTGSVISPYSRYLRGELGRFQFLRDFKLNLTTQYPTRDFKINLSFKKGHKQLHNGGSQGDDMKGTIYFMVISDTGNTATAPTIICTVRTGFTDD